MDTDSPIKDFIIANSGGLIKNNTQAMIVIIVIFVLGILFSLFMISRMVSSQPTEKYANTYDPSTDQEINN